MKRASLRQQLAWSERANRKMRQEHDEELSELREQLRALTAELKAREKQIENLGGIPPWGHDVLHSVNRMVEAVEQMAAFIGNPHAQEALRLYEKQQSLRRKNLLAAAKARRERR